MAIDASWSNGEIFDGAFFSSLCALANANEAGLTGKQASSANLTAWSAKTAPSGVAVGTTDAQSLSGKNLTSGNTFPTFNQDTTGNAAKAGGITITGTPTVGQVLVATSPTAATWQTVSGGGPSGGNIDGGDPTGTGTGTGIDGGTP